MLPDDDTYAVSRRGGGRASCCDYQAVLVSRCGGRTVVYECVPVNRKTMEIREDGQRVEITNLKCAIDGWMVVGRWHLGARAENQHSGSGTTGNPKPRTDRATDKSVAYGPRPGQSTYTVQRTTAQFTGSEVTEPQNSSHFRRWQSWSKVYHISSRLQCFYINKWLLKSGNTPMQFITITGPTVLCPEYEQFSQLTDRFSEEHCILC